MNILFISVLILLLIGAVFLYLIFPAGRKHQLFKRLDGLYIAHRGLHDIKKGIPENSLSAFSKAAAMGLAVEIDIQITADGHIVVFHDNDLSRMCGSEGKIESMTLSELKKLRLLNTDERIPTLQECLDVIDGMVPLVIEFKAGIAHKALCVEADRVLSLYSGEYFIQSFSPMVLNWYKKHRTDVCRGQIATPFKGHRFYMRAVGLLLTNFLARPHFISYDCKHPKNFIRRFCVALGAFSVGWTFTSEKEVNKNKNYFQAFIFENFIPKKK